jgi:DNA-directed RNA polymerase specialized sigma24 family protein
MLDLPLGTVKSRSSRARIELAKAITEMDGGPNGGPIGAEAV